MVCLAQQSVVAAMAKKDIVAAAAQDKITPARTGFFHHIKPLKINRDRITGC